MNSQSKDHKKVNVRTVKSHFKKNTHTPSPQPPPPIQTKKQANKQVNQHTYLSVESWRA